MSQNLEKSLKVLKENKVGVFIVAYNAEKHIESVLKRIPEEIAVNLAEIYIIDDNSPDSTFETASKVDWPEKFAPVKIYKTPFNQGYGGNQKLGYRYAIENDLDIVILLHGDGQYAPESLPDIIAPYDDGYDAVFGSRFITKGGARSGGMPFYKWLGNRVLTGFQNFMLKSNMSEMHSGYRSYRVKSLAQVPFEFNADNFHFDADIIIQFIDAGFKIHEVEIPTYYGDEICHVNGMLYAWNCTRSLIKYRLMQFEIFYDPKFDIRNKSKNHYFTKKAKTSIHSFVRNYFKDKNLKIADIGGGDGESVSKDLSETNEVVCVDHFGNEFEGDFKKLKLDLDESWDELGKNDFDAALALDVIEHLKRPEEGVVKLRKILKTKGSLVASTGNVAFIVIRMMLMIGSFNYGRRGILDLTHTRLMTKNSFRRLLQAGGFRIEKMHYFGIPFEDLKPDSTLFKFLDRCSAFMAKLWPGMFAFQILAVCTKEKDIDDLVEKTFT